MTAKASGRIGILFLLLGIVIIAAALAPVIQHPPAAIAVPILVAGIVVAIFGALIVPSSGAGPALAKIVVVVGPYMPFAGPGRRAGEADGPSPPEKEP